MKATHKSKKTKLNKRVREHRDTTQKQVTPVTIFLITLIAFIVVGTTGLLLIKTLSSQEASEKNRLGQESVTDISTEDDQGLHFPWEKIPEAKVPQVDESGQSKYAAELADEAYCEANRILTKEGHSKDSVTIGFVGDILLDDEYAVMANLVRRGVSIENGISEPLLARMQGVDILVANNEFPFTNRGTPLEGKTYTFRADTGSVTYLHDMGVDVAVLANNHIYDFGETGLLDTLDTLNEAEIPYLGAGRNIEEASAPVYYIVNDIKIAIVAATQIERLDNPDTRGATENSAGTFRCWNPEKLYEVIQEADANSDFVITYIHWGTENEAEPDWAQVDQAKGIAEAGADLIIGDHPHCLQGITYCGETPVFYSIGNFWFNSKTVDTGMVLTTFNAEGLQQLQFVPAIQQDSRTDLVYGSEQERILSYLRNLSPNVQIDADGYIDKLQ